MAERTSVADPTPTHRSPVVPAAIGIVCAAVVPAFLIVSRTWHRAGVTWGPLDAVATVALFASPAAFAAMALARRPSLFLAAAAMTAIMLPLWIFAPLLVISSVAWAVAWDRAARRARGPQRAIAAIASAALIIAAGVLFFFVRGPTVCTSEIRYADGSVRRSTKIEDRPHRHTETIPGPGERTVSSGTSCSEGELLPERSFAILGLVIVAAGVGFVFGTETGEPTT
jgi:hypothetical protein